MGEECDDLIERYTEMVFRTEEELDAKIAELRAKAEFVLRGTRAFRVEDKIIRVQVLKLGDRFYLIHSPREPWAPRVFTVAILWFRLCEIPIRGEECGRRVVTVILRDGELFDVCNYHGAGATAPYPIFRQIAEVPGALCAKFCPQYFKYDELPQCRAFLKPLTEAEVRRRSRPWRGMYFLCKEDGLWWRYLER